MPAHPYALYDVFADTGLAGNPLAVVFDAGDLATEQMQAIAREFNLSETVFICPPEKPVHNAALRIFMPTAELPFAGHPTVGAAVAIAERAGTTGAGPALVMMEEKVGLVRAAVKRDERGLFGEFDLPRLPVRHPNPVTKEAAAAALGLNPTEIGFENHGVSAWSAGVPYICVPVHGLEAAGRAELDVATWVSLFDGMKPLETPCPYVYCRETVLHDSAFHARMFAGAHGIGEDPATGSAAAALIGAIIHFDEPTIGLHRMVIEQGMEMGRPSCITVEMDVEHATLQAARIGGHAVKVAEGTLFV
ncbi:MAG: PhzF family phenazine biosynthesis protein [Notoacmeibacter sp.]|nr:PhzF family phenazine biosynthesis protein [Notoacmeibacter sp.]MCC0032120.1 PhzF family phenazine biosynthesis protein [Brucellaceae bacterium]